MPDDEILTKAIEAAVAVALEEADAVRRLADTANAPEFKKALEICLHCPGTIFILGMGKSGLVGQKIAATLTSTGSPSIYIHPGDALHGDIGAIRAVDVAILISKSGETGEVLRTVPFLKNQGNPIIAITSELSSSLSKSADVTLDMQVTSEACPLNLAPMSSTTATMVIGDALAAALIVARGFRPESFARFHPGGKLGWLLTAKVADMIGPEKNPVAAESETLRQAIVKLVEYRLGGVSVVDSAGRLTGMITDGDLKRIIISGDDHAMNRSVVEFMKKSPVSIPITATAAEALDLMEKRETQISVLPVVDDLYRPVGILRLHDVIRTHL